MALIRLFICFLLAVQVVGGMASTPQNDGVAPVMDEIDWRAHWANSNIGFHLDQANPMLVKHWPALQTVPGDGVFVPLCGKSLDLLELQKQGYFVLGSELSELAVAAFFAENHLSVSRQLAGEHEYWSSEGLAVVLGDFFTLPAGSVPARFVYDRAALVALPPHKQKEYAEHLLRVAPEIEQMLLITVEYDDTRAPAPPFSTPPATVASLYHDHFTIERLETRQTIPSARKQAQGLMTITEHVFKLTRRLTQAVAR